MVATARRRRQWGACMHAADSAIQSMGGIEQNPEQQRVPGGWAWQVATSAVRPRGASAWVCLSCVYDSPEVNLRMQLRPERSCTGRAATACPHSEATLLYQWRKRFVTECE